MEKNFLYMNKKVKLFKYHSESENFFNQRLEFLKNLEKEKVNFKDAIKYSKIWSNIKFKECIYNKKVLEIIRKYDSKI
tara:strand:- start:120 stop:353 length:234 start_codon:yes stop_codon:yes gene_type:complete